MSAEDRRPVSKAVALAYPALSQAGLLLDLAICHFNQAKWWMQEKTNPMVVYGHVNSVLRNRFGTGLKRRHFLMGVLKGYEKGLYTPIIVPLTKATPHLHKAVVIRPWDKRPEAVAVVRAAYTP